MPAIVAKLQRCGKTNCRCFTTGELHGPYFWIVSYRRKKDRNNRGKYEWKYLGKGMKVILEKLANEVPDFFASFGEKKIAQAILRAHDNRKTDFDRNSSAKSRVKPVLGNFTKLKETKGRKLALSPKFED